MYILLSLLNVVVYSIIFDYTVRISSYLTTIMKTALKQNNCSKGDLISNVINIYRLYKRPCKISFNLKDLRSLSLQTSTYLLESKIFIFIDRQINSFKVYESHNI